MKKVYVFSFGDVYIYFRDGEVRLIADVGDTEMIENGIDAAGAELVHCEDVPGIVNDINIEQITIADERTIRQRIAQHIKDNDL